MANHPSNPLRPCSKAVKQALLDDDMVALAKALSFRQKRFCEEYIIDYDGAKAGLRAGYSKNSVGKAATLLLMNDGVSKYVEFLAAKARGQIESVSPDYVISQILSIVNKEAARDGDKLRGLELIAKHLGMFIERTEISGKDGEAIRYEKVQENADAFASAIAGLRDRGGNPVVPLFNDKRTAG